MKIDKTQPFSVACGTEEELAMINERLVSCMGSSADGMQNQNGRGIYNKSSNQQCSRPILVAEGYAKSAAYFGVSIN